MKDYLNVQPDKIKLLNKHFTKGRTAPIQYITRHHLAGRGRTEDVYQWWQTRPASAHYVVEEDGTVGQLVWDRDTAWSNANAASNARSLSIEHANTAGADYPISSATIVAGARLAAALCRYYKLGRPEFGKNIRDHREFGQTSCPHHLAYGGKYHRAWMDEAQAFYDRLVAGTHNDPVITVPEEDHPMSALSDHEQRELLDHIRYIRGQLGPWAQLGHNEKGQPLTLVDALAAVRQHLVRITEAITRITDLFKGKNR